MGIRSFTLLYSGLSGALLVTVSGGWPVTSRQQKKKLVKKMVFMENILTDISILWRYNILDSLALLLRHSEQPIINCFPAAYSDKNEDCKPVVSRHLFIAKKYMAFYDHYF